MAGSTISDPLYACRVRFRQEGHRARSVRAGGLGSVFSSVILSSIQIWELQGNPPGQGAGFPCQFGFSVVQQAAAPPGQDHVGVAAAIR